MKEKVMGRILAVVGFLIGIGGVLRGSLFLGTIGLVLSVSIFGIATLFAFLRLGWNVGDNWDNWIHIGIGVFLLILCGVFIDLALEGFTSNDGFLFGIVFVIAFLLLFAGALHQVGLLKISNDGVKTLVLIFEGVLSVIGVIALFGLTYYLVG